MFPVQPLRFGCQQCRDTSLTVTHTTDAADTEVDYPTFVWLHPAIEPTSHLLDASVQSGLTCSVKKVSYSLEPVCQGGAAAHRNTL